MNRTDLIRAVSNKDEVPPDVVARVVDSMLEVIRLSLSIGEEVTLRGFGRFELKSMSSTVRRAPKSGQLVQVPPRTSVRFIPAQGFRGYLNERAQTNGNH